MTTDWFPRLIANDRSPGETKLIATAVDDPIHAGRFRIDAGRLPKSSTEATVSAVLADELDIQLGDELELSPDKQTFEVVGFVSERIRLRDALVTVTPDTRPVTTWWVDLPQGHDPDTVARQFTAPASAISVEDLLSESKPLVKRAAEVSGAYLAGVFVFLWTGVVASAAFAISARRRLRELGLVTASGATRRQVRRLLVADAAVLGLAGSVFGALSGVVLAWYLVRRLEGSPLIHHETGDFSLPFLPIAGAVAMGTICSVVAGMLPAARAARIPATAALQGRMTRRPHHVRSVAAGLAVGALGTVLIGQGAAAGSQERIALGCGLVALAFALINRLVVAAFAWLTSRTGLSLRFAARDANRNAHRTGPAVAASMLAMAAMVGSVTVAASDMAHDRAHNAHVEDSDARFTVYVQSRLDDGDVSSLEAPLSAAISQVLPAAKVTRDEDPFLDSPGQFGVLINLGRKPKPEEVQKVRAAVHRTLESEVPAGTVQADVWDPSAASYESAWLYGSVAVGSLVSLIVLGLVAALSRAETVTEVRALHSLGISPRRRRRLAGAAGGVLALIAGALAIPTGLVPAVAFLNANKVDGMELPVVVPWAWILAAVGGVALVLTAAGWLTAGKRPVRPVNVIRL